MTDPLERLRQLRPDVPDEQGWAASPAGREAFERVRATGRTRKASWWRRRSFVIPVVVIGLGGGVAGSVAFAQAGRDTVAADELNCVKDANLQSDVYGFDIDPGTPPAKLAQLCLVSWPSAVPNRPAPVAFVMCVYPVARNQGGGGLVGVPSATSLPVEDWPTACQAAGFDPLG